MLLDALDAALHRGQCVVGLALQHVSQPRLSLHIPAQTAPGFLKNLEADVLARQLIARLGFSEDCGDQADLTLHLLPLL
jgi:hypothetical protein